MAKIYFLNKPTRTNLALARKHLHSCFRMVRRGNDKAALRYANQAIAAYETAMHKSTEAHHKFSSSVGAA